MRAWAPMQPAGNWHKHRLCSRRFHTSYQRHLRAAHAHPAPVQSADVYDSLLAWTSRGNISHDNRSLVQVADLGMSGRGLVALQDIPAGQVIMEVPFTKVFKSDPQSQLHWAADMAIRLLNEQHACRQQSPGQQPTTPAHWCPWIDALPRDVLTPLGFAEAAVAALGDTATIAEVQGMQGYFQSCYRTLTGPDRDPSQPPVHCSSYQEFIWAVQVFTSRCFFDASIGCHLAVPGIDMANHSFQPTATVQIRHSVDYCQGKAALEDVCDAPSTSSPSMFQLVAGPDGVQAGEEVTICYGATWPNEPFLLLFGFVPGDNPAEGVILFPSFVDLVIAHAQHCIGASSQASEGGDDELVEELLSQPGMAEAAQSGEWDRLLISDGGVDPRMAGAVELIRQAALGAGCSVQGDGGAVQEQLQLLVHTACQALLQELESAGAATAAGVPGMEVAALFRQQKQHILQHALARSQSQKR